MDKKVSHFPYFMDLFHDIFRNTDLRTDTTNENLGGSVFLVLWWTIAIPELSQTRLKFGKHTNYVCSFKFLYRLR